MPDTFETLFGVLVHPTAFITRLAITLLDVWQAYLAVAFGVWYIGSLSEFLVYYTFGLAVASVIALLSNSITGLTVCVLFVNLLQFMYLTIAALAFYPPMVSTGLYFFTMLMSLSAFWRSLLYLIGERHGDTHGQRYP